MNPTLLTDPRHDARAFVRRYIFGTSAVLSGIGALLMATNGAMPMPGRLWMFIGFLSSTAFSLIAWRWTGLRSDIGMLVTCIAGLLLIGGTSVLSGAGLNAPVIGFLCVAPFVMSATVNSRLGLLVAAAGAVLLMALAWAEQGGWLPGGNAVASLPLPRRLVTLLVLVGVGLAAGHLVSRVFDHYLGASRDREMRFRGLLGIAADSYWEMNEQYIVTAVWRRQSDQRFLPTPQPMTRPWDQEGMLYDEGALAAHQADLQARRPFRDLHVRWRRPDGSLRHELVSGEPRFDDGGRFLGYWGVSRDISDRVAAAEALRRSEAMLSHLVTTSPDLITLTDLSTGRYVMVNEAFTRFSGHSAAEALGRTALELGVWVSPQAREDFLQRLREQGSVKDLPIVFVSKSGLRYSLLISAASFEMEGGRYLVLNGRDVTAAETARLAHEAVLQNASLGIAFTRAQVFVQANPALEKMLGWPPGGLLGQPGRAVWASDDEYLEVGTLIGSALARGESVEIVRELTRRDGVKFWCRMLAKAVDPRHPMAGGTIWIVEDITERRRVEQALAKARDDAEAANRAKSAFLANTSHEIRTPLNGLVGLARLARRPDVDEARRRQYLDQIADSAETLSAVISDVLDLSKIEAGKLDVEQLAFDLHALLESLRQVYGTLADARGLEFGFTRGAGVPQWVWGDPVRVRQVLGNFLNNALKFTAKGSVQLRAVVDGGDTLRFEVEDTGPGITHEVRARLFQPFTQADQSTTRRFGGSGLGLSICRELATLMHGTVGVESEPGRGSRFWAALPLPATEAPAHDSGFGVLDPSPLADARVLMVEDNAVNMTIAVAMLEQWGVSVDQALDGAQAVQAVERAAAQGRPFDLVLMDVQMPVMSGYEATRLLRERPAGDRLPIIALTAAALSSEREQALASGMNGFLTKPIDAQQLHDSLVTALGRSS
ncbi:PAS domain S-box protein [Rhizobacter sp. AJA081-3]|nr:PAS domain S-box protein [Rhizobacter sp. AJA081-3]